MTPRRRFLTLVRGMAGAAILAACTSFVMNTETTRFQGLFVP